MSDKIKILLALIFFVLGMVLPFFGVAAMFASWLGWIQTDASVGLAITIGTFLVFFGLGGVMLFWVKDLSWLTVSLPYLFSSLYTFLPDLIPFSLDDAAAMTAGAILSTFLAIRKNPATPRWVILPLIGAAVYTFFGGALPGPVDELLVNLLAFLVAAYGAKRNE